MAYWWVAQTPSYEWALKTGHLWASRYDRAGRTPAARRALGEVEPGDILFSVVKRQIVALMRPQGWPTEGVEDGEPGWRIRVDIQPLKHVLPIDEVLKDLRPLLAGAEHSPLDRNGNGRQGYIFDVPSEAGQFIRESLRRRGNRFGHVRVDRLAENSIDDDPAILEIEGEEGRRTLRRHLRSERSNKLVAAFKRRLKSFRCTVCGFDYEQAYGDLGSRFIECHHTRPVSDMKPGDRTKLTDLVAVCANCHRMLHRRSPPLSVKELHGRVVHLICPRESGHL